MWWVSGYKYPSIELVDCNAGKLHSLTQAVPSEHGWTHTCLQSGLHWLSPKSPNLVGVKSCATDGQPCSTACPGPAGGVQSLLCFPAHSLPTWLAWRTMQSVSENDGLWLVQDSREIQPAEAVDPATRQLEQQQHLASTQMGQRRVRPEHHQVQTRLTVGTYQRNRPLDMLGVHADVHTLLLTFQPVVTKPPRAQREMLLPRHSDW